MSGMASCTPGMEVSGDSPGFGIAVGMCLAPRRKESAAFVHNLMSDGELDEGHTWEAAMSAGSHGLGNLIALIDVNGMLADGACAGVLNFEPLAPKWAAFGWHTRRVDGNDLDAACALGGGASPRDHIRHLQGQGGAVLGGARAQPLPAGGRGRVGARAGRDRSWEGRMSHAAEAPLGTPPGTPKKRLTTSAMIASLAAEGQRTRSAPFGHALAAPAETRPEIVGLTADLGLPGLTTGYGPSHQATEDIAMFQAMPNLTIVDPCDALDLGQAVPAIADHEGPVHMRPLRGNVPPVLDECDCRFELGRAKLLRDGAEAVARSIKGWL